MIVVIMGVSGSGKSTVGRALADRAGIPFRDADDFHPPANVRAMAAGLPLTDEMRRPWLDAMNREIRQAAADSRSLVLACSALKRSYRDRLMQGAPEISLIYLQGGYEEILSRMHQRQGHFMPPSLLQSQLDTLQEPTPDEHPVIISVTCSIEEIVNAALAGITSDRVQNQADARIPERCIPQPPNSKPKEV